MAVVGPLLMSLSSGPVWVRGLGALVDVFVEFVVLGARGRDRAMDVSWIVSQMEEWEC